MTEETAKELIAAIRELSEALKRQPQQFYNPIPAPSIGDPFHPLPLHPVVTC